MKLIIQKNHKPSVLTTLLCCNYRSFQLLWFFLLFEVHMSCILSQHMISASVRKRLLSREMQMLNVYVWYPELIMTLNIHFAFIYTAKYCLTKQFCLVFQNNYLIKIHLLEKQNDIKSCFWKLHQNEVSLSLKQTV